MKLYVYGLMDEDPVLRRRRQAAHLAKMAKRYGYLLWLAAVVLFFVALVTGLPGALTTAILVCMAVGSVLLLPAIVVGYGVKAADREDREHEDRERRRGVLP